MSTHSSSKTETNDTRQGTQSPSSFGSSDKNKPFEKASEQAVTKQQLDDENRGPSRDFSQPYSKLPSAQGHPPLSDKELKKEMEKEEYNHVKNSELGKTEENQSQAYIKNPNSPYIDPKIAWDTEKSHRPHSSEVHNHPLHSQDLRAANENLQEKASDMIDSTKDTLRQGYQNAKETMTNQTEPFSAQNQQVNPRSNVTDRAKDIIETGKQYASDVADKAQRKIGDAYEAVEESNVVDKAKDTLSKAKDTVSETATNIKDTVQEKGRDLKDQAQTQMNRLEDKTLQYKDQAQKSMRDVKDYVAEKGNDAINSLEKESRDLRRQASSELADVKDKVIDVTSSTKQQLTNKMSNTAENLKNKAENLAEDAADKLSDLKQDIANKMAKSPTMNQMMNKASEIKDDAMSKVSNVTEKVADKLADSKDEIINETSKIKEKASDVLEKTTDKLSKAYTTVKNSETMEDIKEQATDLKDKVVSAYESAKKSPVVKSMENKAVDIKDQVADKLSEIPKAVSPTKIHNVEKKLVDMAYNVKEKTDDFKSNQVVHKLTDTLQATSMMLSGAYDAVKEKVARMVFEDSAFQNNTQEPLSNFNARNYDRMKSETVSSPRNSDANITQRERSPNYSEGQRTNRSQSTDSLKEYDQFKME